MAFQDDPTISCFRRSVLKSERMETQYQTCVSLQTLASKKFTSKKIAKKYFYFSSSIKKNGGLHLESAIENRSRRTGGTLPDVDREKFILSDRRRCGVDRSAAAVDRRQEVASIEGAQ